MDVAYFEANEQPAYFVCAQCGGQIEMRSDGSVMMPRDERTQILYTRLEGLPVIAFFCSKRCSDRAMRKVSEP